MKKNPGYVVKITTGVHEGKYGLVYYAEQTREVLARSKALVNVCEGGAQNFSPVLDADGKQVKILKNNNHLTVIGYTD